MGMNFMTEGISPYPEIWSGSLDMTAKAFNFLARSMSATSRESCMTASVSPWTVATTNRHTYPFVRDVLVLDSESPSGRPPLPHAPLRPPRPENSATFTSPGFFFISAASSVGVLN